VWRWAERFRDQGVAGVRDKPKGHNPAKLDSEKRRRVAQWLKAGKNNEGERVHWTPALLVDEVERVFGIKMSIASMWTTVHGMGFRQKVPCPAHAKADPQTQERLKKKRLIKSFHWILPWVNTEIMSFYLQKFSLEYCREKSCSSWIRRVGMTRKTNISIEFLPA